jgi:hypothetical protein
MALPKSISVQAAAVVASVFLHTGAVASPEKISPRLTTPVMLSAHY